ncbi:hypothetical protein ACRASX_02210 [Flavobacterium sp. TMP13]|uniref:hypothetical protein n=1 Tax=unclassified Flavobacterium TaxID=196869 RepID=UPI00076D5A3D|nr:hypothetical protein [Flavobacterium sp. TAB 87]KVV14380.1 hypothetical protein AP058_02272 [Flavobacterium sp. TAB 87]
MNAIDKAGMEIVTKIILESMKANGIYCFGEKKKRNIDQNIFNLTEAELFKHTHFYLLIIAPDSRTNLAGDLADLVRTKTKGKYSTTLLIHNAVSIRPLTSHRLYFFYEVFKKGYTLYENEIVPPNIAIDEIPSRKLKLIRSHWRNRNKIAETFLDAENQIDGFDTELIQECMLHIVVEQTCLALIDVFLGYRPNHFSLVYLFDICEIFCSLTTDTFPRKTEEDKKLFELLKVNLSSLRWVELKTSSFLNTEILERRCHIFQEKATILIETELERLENVELKNQSHANK